MSRELLRVCVLLDAPVVPAWIHRALTAVEPLHGAQLVLAVFDATPIPAPALAFRAYEALDRRFFALPRDHSAPVGLSALLAACPQVVAEPARTRDGYALAPRVLKQISEAHPDLILKLGFPPLDGELITLSRLGVWSFDHVEAARRGCPPFFWEMVRHTAVTETVLRASTAEGSRVLVRSWAATDPTSLHRSRSPALWKASSFLERAFSRAVAGTLEEGGDDLVPVSLEVPARAPNAIEIARFAAGAARGVFRERRRTRREEFVWFVAARPARDAWLDGALDGFRPIEPPPGCFQADPFLVHDAGRTWLFVEEADQKARHGWIRCSEQLADGTLGESRIVLERDYHLSYPFVFQHGGAWYMLPETQENRTIELWRATQFPWRWTLDRVLFSDVAAVDSTIVEHAGRLWLFTAMSPTGGSLNDELFLFSADSLHGEWTPHPRNPIVSDVRRARPAGRLFREGGQLYRPAQDCSGHYGSAIWLHRVDALDAQRYRETPVRRIDTGWWPGALCTHTIDRAGGFEVIDARTWRKPGQRLSR